jgi:diacylglycerol O-acyltransferase / wax synthase
VHRLNGLESAFLLRENATQNANTGVLIRLRLDDPAHPITLGALREHVRARLDLVPSLRWRIREVPLGLHHPVMVDDPDFRLERHLGELTLPAPGDEATRNDEFARVTTRTFDRNHPVWKMTLVSGLADGTQALFFIFHHILMDGVGYISTLDGLFTDQPPVDPPYARPWTPERPSKSALLGCALRDQAAQLARLPRLVRDTRTGRAAMAARIAQTRDQVPPPPPTRLALDPDYAPSLQRAFATVDLPFEQVRAVRKGGDVTINTVLMAVTAISLRRYLQRRDRLPEAPLVSGVMASTEALDAPPRQAGNLFANFIVSLATDLDDPWEQMLTISRATIEGKARLELLGIDMQNRWLEIMPPIVGKPLTRRQDKQRQANPTQMRSSVAFSNVRGAPGYHFLGSTITGLYTYGPIADSIGIFISSTNLGDFFHMVVIANPRALEDPAELAASFRDTLDELVQLAATRA